MHPDNTRSVQVSTTHAVIDASTPLFQLTLQVPQLPVTDRAYPNAWLAILWTNGPPRLYNFWSLLLDYTPGLEHEYGALFLMQDCFTSEEMELIRSYFERHPWPGARLIPEPVCLPVPCSTLPTQLLHRPGPWIRCPFDREWYFDCPIAFEGYFNPQWPHRVQAALDTGRQRTRCGHA